MGIAMMMAVCFFAVYGVLQMLAKSAFRFQARRCGCPAYIHRTVALRDCQDSVEGMVRSLIWEDLREELLVIDLGSKDQTGEILRRLEKDYSFLHVMTPDQYRDYIDTMDKA